MKYYPVFFLLTIFILNKGVNAQIGKLHSWNLSIGADLAYPENAFRKTHSWGYGATFKSEYVFANHTSVTGSVGLYQFSSKTNLLNPGGERLTGLPIKLGGRYYLGNFYLGGDAGLLLQGGYKKNEGFAYSFLLGDELITGKNGNSLDISFRYEAWVTEIRRSFVGLRLAYEFRLR